MKTLVLCCNDDDEEPFSNKRNEGDVEEEDVSVML